MSLPNVDVSTSAEPEKVQAETTKATGSDPAAPKLHKVYVHAYRNFMKWRENTDVDTFTEDVFMDYFQELAKTKLPSTLWSLYSMLKTTVGIHHGVKIETYAKLTAYMKETYMGHKSKKSKVFKSAHLETFLRDAPDDDFLGIKVGLIFGILGACRCIELLRMTTDDITRPDDETMIVRLTDEKTKIDRSFTIRDEYKDFVDRYEDLRPPEVKTNRFFLRFYKGRCYNQIIGKDKIFRMPQEIATFLKLPDAKLYTGHCFRRTSATLLSDSGANLSALKKRGGWKSAKVAQVFIRDTLKKKKRIKKHIDKMKKLKMLNNPTTSVSDAQTTSVDLTKQGPLVNAPQHQVSEVILNAKIVENGLLIAIPNDDTTLFPEHKCSKCE